MIDPWNSQIQTVVQTIHEHLWTAASAVDELIPCNLMPPADKLCLLLKEWLSSEHVLLDSESPALHWLVTDDANGPNCSGSM